MVLLRMPNRFASPVMKWIRIHWRFIHVKRKGLQKDLFCIINYLPHQSILDRTTLVCETRPDILPSPVASLPWDGCFPAIRPWCDRRDRGEERVGYKYGGRPWKKNDASSLMDKFVVVFLWIWQSWWLSWKGLKIYIEDWWINDDVSHEWQEKKRNQSGLDEGPAGRQAAVRFMRKGGHKLKVFFSCFKKGVFQILLKQNNNKNGKPVCASLLPKRESGRVLSNQYWEKRLDANMCWSKRKSFVMRNFFIS